MKRKKKPFKIIVNLTVKSFEVIELTGITFIVKNDIKIEPNGELIVKNAKLVFEKEAGIVGIDSIFKAENSTFEPLKSSLGWKNITLVGNIKGHIKGSTFIGARGRLGKELNTLSDKFLDKKISYGGALFVCSNGERYLISGSRFVNCSADKGGGVYAQNSRIESSSFDSCSASSFGGAVWSESSIITNSGFDGCEASFKGGGVWADSSTLENCQFKNCSAKEGGGVCAFYSTLKECSFENCSADVGGGGLVWFDTRLEHCSFTGCKADYGGGVFARFDNSIITCSLNYCFANRGGGIFAEENNNIKECSFSDCKAQENGGGIFCQQNFNSLISNSFKNCKPDNCKGDCSC